MQKWIMIGALLCLGPWSLASWAGGRHIDRCNAFLWAPEDLKTSTRALLKVVPRSSELESAQSELLAYIASAPLGDVQVLSYLRAIHDDSPGERRAVHTDFNFSIVNRYLLRAGNEDLAGKNLNVVLENYWEDIIDSRARPEQWAWLEEQTKGIERLADAFPAAVSDAWDDVTPGRVKELVNYGDLNPVFASTGSYIEEYLNWSRDDLADDNQAFARGDEETVRSRERVEYAGRIAQEIAQVPAETNISALKSLVTFKSQADFGNSALSADVGPWKGDALDTNESTLAQIVFVTRLSRRLKLWAPEQKRFEGYIKRILNLMPRYPRRENSRRIT